MNRQRKSEIRAKLCDRLEKLRKHKGFSYKEMADAADIDKAEYIRIEKGERMPGTFILCDLAAALGVSVSELLKGVDANS